MPGNVAAAAPATVMPDFVSRSFEAVLEFVTDLNTYGDGSGQAKSLVTLPRRTWRAEIPCDSTLLAALRAFWLARRCVEPFYFYYWRETSPLGSTDPAGLSTVGRYAVQFNGPWSEEFTLGRNSVQVELVEVL